MTLRDLYTIRYRAIILNRLINVVNLYVHLKGNTKYDEPTTALKKFIDDVKVRLESIKNLRLYTFIEYAYSTITILDKYGIIAFCVPSYDMLKPWKWVLLLHELGHIMFNIRKDFFTREFREKILPMLRELAPISIRREVTALLSIWEQNWLKELISDLYAVATGGPAYTYAFMVEVFESNPSQYTLTHPSLDSRIYVQLNYLKRIEGMKELIGDVKELWLSHRGNILARGLSYPFPQAILEELVNIFINVIKKPVFPNLLDKISDLRLQIDRGKVTVAAPLPLILALTLSSNRRNNTLQRKVIKIIAADQ